VLLKSDLDVQQTHFSQQLTWIPGEIVVNCQKVHHNFMIIGLYYKNIFTFVSGACTINVLLALALAFTSVINYACKRRYSLEHHSRVIILQL
jgi:hypothetical protein